MAQVQMPNGIFQERTALLDRIQCFEATAQRSRDDRVSVGVDVIQEHIAYANARLDQINYMIAFLKAATISSETGHYKRMAPALSR